MPCEKIDILVVGAGPAGLCAAWKAAASGASILLVDKKKKIGEPIQCAEASFLPVLKTFDMHEGGWVLRPYDTIKVHVGGRSFHAKAKRLGPVALDRTKMENELARRAREEGAEIKAGCGLVSLKSGVAHLGSGDALEPHIIIGADGIGSTVGRQSGILDALAVEDVGSSAQYLLEGGGWDAYAMSIFLGRNTPGGYAWVFPKSESRANVGIMVQGQLGRASRLLDAFVEHRFPGALRIEHRGGCAPTALPPDSLVKGNVLLAGDAGRLVFPFGAAGIHTALFSGSVAGRVAAGTIGGEMTLAEYDRIWRRCLLGQLRRNYRLKERTFSSQRGLARTVRMIRIGSALINVLPVNPMRLWWGRMEGSA